MTGNIVLCGFMGCGKTSVGRRAAKPALRLSGPLLCEAEL